MFIRASIFLVLGLLSLSALSAEESSVGVVSHLKIVSDKVPDVTSLEAWKKSYIKEGSTPAEQALSIWKSVATFQHQDSPPYEFLQHEDLVYDPIKVFNVYGYAMCCNATAHVSGLARYAGLDARGWGVNHHSIGEIFYDDAWHHFDASLIAYYPKADGKIASVEELTAEVKGWYAQHPDCFDGKHGIDAKLRQFERLDERTAWKQKGPPTLAHNPTFSAVGWYPAGTHGWYAGMQVFDGTSGDQPAFHYEYGPSMGYEVNIQLRPGEKLTRNWSNKGLHVNMDGAGGVPGCLDDKHGFLKAYDAKFGSLAPGRVGNGTLEYDVPLKSGAFKGGALAVENLSSTADDQAAPALHVKDAAQPATYILRMPSSYVYLGGELNCQAVVGDGGAIRVLFSENNGLDWKELAAFASSGAQKVDLKAYVYRRYDYRLKFELKGTGTGLDALKITHDIQHSQRPLPAFEQGENTLTFSAGPQEGTVTVEANTLKNHAGKQAEYTEFKSELAGLDGAPLRVAGAEGSLTVPVQTPGDMVRLRANFHVGTWSPNEKWELQYSFDGGKTFNSAGSFACPDRGRNYYAVISAVPKGVREAKVRFAGHKSSETCLWSFRVDADYVEPHGGFAPVKVTYTWSENGADKQQVFVAQKPDEIWKVSCAAKPVMKSIVMELGE